jgi:predicted ArsR family transcriptional regulator
MEKALWYLLAGTRGGKNRARIIRVLSERPRNANQISDEVDLEYNTVRYHLEKLVDHDVVETGGEDYGELYFLTNLFERHEAEFQRITDRMED